MCKIENINKTKQDLIKELEASHQKIAQLNSEYEKIREKLHNSEKRSLAWLENSPVCTKILDPDFNLQYMSAAGVNSLKISDISSYYGKPYPLDFYPKSFKGPMNEGLARVRELGEIVTLEDSITDTSGKELWFNSTLVPINDDNDRLDYIMVVSINITKRKGLERQLRQSQKMEAIGILTGGIAHEFNNLLSPILGYTEMLLKDESRSDSDKMDLEQIHLAGGRSKVLVQKMLAYGRQSISKRESIKLDAVVDEVLTLIQNTIPANISVKKDVDVNLPQIWGMPNEIHQVLLNLCINASGAMKNGGELTVALKMKQMSESAKTNELCREEIILSVYDNGKGIESNILECIFDPFFTTKDAGEGSGLGLSVVQGIVEQHDGRIEVDSKIGQGSVFHIYFPVSRKETKSTIVEVKSLSRGNNDKILLVDDSEIVLSLTKRMLQKLGYEVLAFLDCIEALDHFAKCPNNFDLIITDYEMGEMNGKQLSEKIKKIRTDIPIILCTGYGNLVAKDDISLWQIDDLLIKPCSLQDFNDALVKILKNNQSKAPIRIAK